MSTAWVLPNRGTVVVGGRRDNNSSRCVGGFDVLLVNDDDENENDDDFPFLFGSRVNSMKDRLDLVVDGSSMSSPRDYLRRQSSIRGLGCVDFNYPQHFGSDHWTPTEARAALDESDLVAGAVCLRYPAMKFARGAMNHPDAATRREAIEMTKRAADAARVLGCNE